MAKATLLSWTNSPLMTLFWLWQASKSNDELPSDLLGATVSLVDLEQLFKDLYLQEIPVIENVSFTFILEDVSVSFREQMVRHRVGVRVGDRVGCDILPELAESSWWSQSMRILPMGNFAKEGRYRTAETVYTNPEAVGIYETLMHQAQDAYNALVAAGVPMEDARDVIPLGTTHRISWTLNLRAMKHLVGKRACWILQASLWHEVIESMIEELVKKVHPIFRMLAAPPCIDIASDEFRSCAFQHENDRRLDGYDQLPVCPLWLVKECGLDLDKTCNRIPMVKEMAERAVQYARFWRHDPYTWEKL